MVRVGGAAILAAAMLAGVGGCGSDDEPVDAGAPGGDGGLDLEDPGDYRAVEATEDGAPRPFVPGTEVSIRFADGEISANAGCNSIGGSYSLEGDVLRVAAASMTEMGCDGPRHDQDQWLSTFLSAGPTVTEEADAVVLRTSTTTLRLVDRRDVEPDAALVGTTWTVSGFIDGETASSSSAADRAPGMVLGADGRIQGHDGCNDFAADYVVAGSEITTSAPESTQRACDDERTAEAVRAVLGTTVTYEITGSNLTLVAPDGRGVTYTAEG